MKPTKLKPKQPAPTELLQVAVSSLKLEGFDVTVQTLQALQERQGTHESSGKRRKAV